VVIHYQQRAGQIPIKLMGISAERLNCNSDPVSYQRADKLIRQLTSFNIELLSLS
jgi:hypothetical protein